MERAREIIREVLSKSQYPAILWSGGKDSMLLLSLIRDMKEDIPVILFHHNLSDFQKQQIMDLDLHVWSWEPSDVYVLPSDKGLSVIREQAFGQHRFPVVLDIQEGEKCIADCFQERTLELFPHFDALFIGYKDTDYHPTLGSNFCPADGWELGRAKVYAPIRYMTDEQVIAELEKRDIPYDTEDSNEVRACTRCLASDAETVFCPKAQALIPRVDWKPAESLRAFQTRFGFKEAA